MTPREQAIWDATYATHIGMATATLTRWNGSRDQKAQEKLRADILADARAAADLAVEGVREER